MTDITTGIDMWGWNVSETIIITDARTKNIVELIKHRNKHANILDPNKIEHKKSMELLIKRLKSMGWIKEEKDCYALTQEGRENVERYRRGRL